MPKCVEQDRGKQRIAGFSAFSEGHVHQKPVAVDILGSEFNGLARSEPSAIDGQQHGAMFEIFDGHEKSRHLIKTQNDGHLASLFDKWKGLWIPVLPKGGDEEVAQSCDSDIDGTGSPLPLIQKLELMLKNRLDGDGVWILDPVLGEKLPDMPDIVLDRRIAKSTKLEVSDITFTELTHD